MALYWQEVRKMSTRKQIRECVLPVWCCPVRAWCDFELNLFQPVFYGKQRIMPSRFLLFPALLLIVEIILFAPLLNAEERREKQQVAVEADAAASPFVKLARQASPSIVTVAHLGRDGRELGIGTGFIINAKGLIATNLHVIGEARMIRVKFQNGTIAAVKTVHAVERDADLAILQVETANLDRSILKAIPLGETAEQGEIVAAIGHPKGLKDTLVTGVVSGYQEINGRELIQVSMPIDFGNSGGPLLNQRGEVIGIITYKSASTNSIGFAMPVVDLKRLMKNPHPVSMNRWITIGAIDSNVWHPLDPAMWRQRAGRIHVSGIGKGFGGRAICLWQQAPKKPQRYEVAVSVRLEDESGAAGLVFQTDNRQRHYGFYPSNSRLRISRFDGPDVFNWHVLKERSSAHYHPGEWNFLKVSVEGTRIKCYCNDHLIFDIRDGVYVTGKVGLAKFRNTVAMFRNFQVAEKIADYHLDSETAGRLHSLLKEKDNRQLLSAETVEQISRFPEKSAVNLEEAARELEQRAKKLRRLTHLVHEHRLSLQIAEELKRKQPRLEKLALLLAKFDNAEVDVASYENTLSRLAGEIREQISEKQDDPKQRREEFDRLFFQEYGYHGSTTNYYNKSNSYLNEVIDDREGLPISLSVLYMTIARELNLDIRGVGLPGHFVVQQYIDDKPGEVIDVFEKGVVLSPVDMVTRVEIQTGKPWSDDYLLPQSVSDVFLRMIRNLKGIAESKEDFDDILRYTNLLVMVDSKHEAENRYLRALINIRGKRAEIAYEDLDWLSENAKQTIGPARINELRRFADRWLQNSSAEEK